MCIATSLLRVWFGKPFTETTLGFRLACMTLTQSLSTRVFGLARFREHQICSLVFMLWLLSTREAVPTHLDQLAAVLLHCMQQG